MTLPFADDPDPWGQGIYARPLPVRGDSPGPANPPPVPDPPRHHGDTSDDRPRHFRTVEDFVNGYLAAVIARRMGQGTSLWCPEWWRHNEAVVRFTALWRAFEHMATDPDEGLSTWWIHHADPHLRALMDPDFGPFALCDPFDGHAQRSLETLPVRNAPENLWNNPLFRVGLDPREG